MTELVVPPASLVRTVTSRFARELRERYGEAVHAVRLFGSFARGDHADGSDVDALVDFEDGVGLSQVARLVVALEALLGSHVDVVSAGALGPWDDVLEEAAPL